MTTVVPFDGGGKMHDHKHQYRLKKASRRLMLFECIPCGRYFLTLRTRYILRFYGKC